MNFITTTELRKKSSQLVNALKAGTSVSLVHRSKIVGIINPAKKEAKVFTKNSIKQLKKIAEQLNLPKMSYEERDKAYRKNMMEKYGKDLS